VPVELRGPLEQVNALLARLEESFAHERRFSADVSHELRTPLAALRAVLQLALSRPREEGDYRGAIARATAMVEQLVGIVERLLMLARAEAGQIQGKLVDVAIRPLVEERWFALREAAETRDLQFDNDIGEEDTLLTDEATLVVVVGNLLDNAVAYTDRGGRIRVRRPPGTVLEVWDSGPVPDAKARERMFDRFWREEVARSGDGVHVGLGLPLARSMARAVGLEVVALAVDGGFAMRLSRHRDR
jgi:signal transduction histidine kinase